MLKASMMAAGAALLLGAGAALADTAGAPLAIEPVAETLQPAAAGDASTPIREGAASKAAGSGGCGWGAKTAYLGS
jgi:hypothetical protein